MKFFTGKKPQKSPKFVIPEWKPFRVGDVIEMKGAFFQISNINPLARQIILRGIQDPRQQNGDKK